MTVNLTTERDRVIIRVDGRVDTSTAPEFSEAMENAFSKSNDIILNCEKLNYISSAGLRVLLSAHKKANNLGGRFVVSNVNELVTDIFETTGFSDILNIV